MQTQKITRYSRETKNYKNLMAIHKSSLNHFLRPSLDAKLFMSQLNLIWIIKKEDPNYLDRLNWFKRQS